MDRRKAVGAAIFALSIAGFVAYAYLLMLSEWSPIVMQLSVLMIVGGILGAISWMGYTMATTRPSSASVYFDVNRVFSPPPPPKAEGDGSCDSSSGGDSGGSGGSGGGGGGAPPPGTAPSR